MRVVICQDCLALAPYTDARHNEDELCTCGGQWCGCDMCADTAQRLRQGERDPSVLGINGEIRFWCEETGIRESA